jgi:hypothetical protein
LSTIGLTGKLGATNESTRGDWPVFENSVGVKNLEVSESVVFYKIQKNLMKFRKTQSKCI